MIQTTWGWLIVIYLFLGGLGAGAFISAALAYKGYLGNIHPKFYRFGFIAAPIILIVGTLMLLGDISPQSALNPLALMHLYTRPISIMSIGVYLITLFIVFSMINAFLMLSKRNMSNTLLSFTCILALGVTIYTGVLLYVVKSIPLWSTAFLPILFMVSALSTGLSLNSLYLALSGQSIDKKVHQYHSLLVVAEAIAIICWIVTAAASHPKGLESVTILMMGSFAPIFWLILIGCGILLPLIVNGRHLKQFAFARSINQQDSDQVLVLEKEHSAGLTIFVELAVLVAGFFLRMLVIFAALSIF